MAQLKIINHQTLLTGIITTTAVTPSLSMDGAQVFSAQVNVDVDTPSAKAFNSGAAATLVFQDITYTSRTRSDEGNETTIDYVGGGTAGNEVVTVTGDQIQVTMQDGVSTATQINTKMTASAPAQAIISNVISGTGSHAQTAEGPNNLEDGVDSDVNTTANTVTLTNHGLTTGLKGQLTSTGTLPGGLSTSTDYYIIVVDANTIQFASSLANALAGTAIDLTTQGSDGAVNTFTPTAIAGGSVKMQKSNDGINWNDEGSSTNITADGSIWLEKTWPASIYMRLFYTLTAGSMSISSSIVTKGLN